MKPTLNRICLLCLLVVLLSYSSIYSSDNKWGVKIELSKQEYLLYERIVLDVTITNNTSDTARTYGLFCPEHLDFHVQLIDGYGKQLEYSGLRFSAGGGLGRLLLRAGEQDYACFDLLQSFGSVTASSGYDVLGTRFLFVAKGTYSVTVKYEGNSSNELTFNIVEPLGQEETVLRKIEQASKIFCRGDTDPSAQIFMEIARDYPNSVYVEKCYYLSRVYANNMAEVRETSYNSNRNLKSDMLSRFPNSSEVSPWIATLTYRMTDDEKVAQYNKVIEEHPDTRASKIASLLKKRIMAKRE